MKSFEERMTKAFDRRMAKAKARRNLILDTAETDAVCRTNTERALFHYFNPNGAKGRKAKLNAILSDAVDKGICTTGAILAYGSMSDDFSNESLYALAQKRRVTRIDVQVALSGIYRNTRILENYLKEKGVAF